MEDVSFETADGRCYNLNGQCLTNPMKELCIKKGRAGMMLVRPSTDQNIFVFFYKECLLFRFFLLSLHRKVTSFRGVAFEVFIICYWMSVQMMRDIRQSERLFGRLHTFVR